MGGSSSRGTERRVSETDQSVGGSDGEAQLSRDTVFKTLSNRRRRLTLQYLSEHGTNDAPVRLRDLAEWIAAAENDVPVESVTYKQRKRVYTSLYQSHLPALHRDGIVQYDRARGTISMTPATGTFDTYLGFTSQTGSAWSLYWLGLGVALLLVALLSWFNVVSFPISSPLLTLVVSLVVLASAVIFAHTGARSD
ncbi:DUF7344 domain-containing protein [Natronorubrum aibiense]|uniref:DUF7344 domain-containing protein n=1 Tax=Natronorubrum aibiense TaxID=348826 RepID=A0A5P9P942_9EURY|nr:hypothetical protein [Natronorubrum aibiense]QFU84643.1 hypothetical protein GCU68_19125 [Natronorubrum aibiense]